MGGGTGGNNGGRDQIEYRQLDFSRHRTNTYDQFKNLLDVQCTYVHMYMMNFNCFKQIITKIMKRC